MIFEQGDIVEVNFGPAVGHEPTKIRPALVVSSNEFNTRTSMTVLCPITTADNGFFLHEPISVEHDVYGFIVMEQLRAIDLNARHVKLTDHLSEREMQPILICLRSFFDSDVY
jgi:mRNA interferase MazF